MSVSEFRSLAELEAALPDILSSPATRGELRLIVTRPGRTLRETRALVECSPGGGIHGDDWATNCWKHLPDGSSDPAVQVTLMNARVIAAIAGDIANWPLAGDQLFVDFDIGAGNLPIGAQFSIGTCKFEATPEPHRGCGKFKSRYGEDALAFVNSRTRDDLRLRGVYARVIEGGTISVGDAIVKLG